MLFLQPQKIKITLMCWRTLLWPAEKNTARKLKMSSIYEEKKTFGQKRKRNSSQPKNIWIVKVKLKEGHTHFTS